MKRFISILNGFVIILILFQSVNAQSIFDAVRTGRLDTVKILLESNPQCINEKDVRQRTPLHAAIRLGKKDIAIYLINKGAAIEEKDAQGRTPLAFVALYMGDIELTKILVEKGADINSTDNEKTCVLFWATIRGFGEMIDFLLDKDVLIPSPKEYLGELLMVYALQNGQNKLFDRLISAGYDILERDDANATLLHRAAAGGSVEILDKLIKAGLKVSEPNIYGRTPLHIAAERGQKEAVVFLLKKGALINTRTIDGYSAYNFAVEMDKREIADLLSSKGADTSEPKFPAISGEYFGQKPPGKKPEQFAIGILTRNNFHSSIMFFPDGKEAYWSVMDFGKSRSYAILESKLVNGRWTPPQLAPFSEVGQMDDSPFISPDGKKLFFISRRPLDPGGRSGKANIWVMDRTGTGWSEPKPLPPIINSLEGIHWQFSVDLQGNLYFSSNADGRPNIYRAKYVNSEYEKPEKLDSTINIDGEKSQPFIAPDGSFLIFAVHEAAVNGQHISYLKKDGSWTEPRNLSDFIMGFPECLSVTQDGKYLFFIKGVASSSKPFWISASFIEALRPKE